MADFSEKESDLLLSVSMDIANIKDKNALLTLVNTKVKTLISFSSFSISTITRSKNTLCNFLFDCHPGLSMHPDCGRYLTCETKIDGKPMSSLVYLEGLKVFNPELDENIQQLSEVKFLLESGIRQVMIAVLQNSQEILGQIKFYFETGQDFKPHTLKLISRIVDLIAVAVSNILFVEEIKKTEEEKTLLLSFSNNMAMVRTKQDLNMIISKRLKKICFIKDYVLSVIHEGGNTHGGFIYNAQAGYTGFPEFTKAMDTKFEIDDGVFNSIIISNNIISYEIDELLSRTTVPEYIRFWKSIGISTVICIALKYLEEPIGVLWIEPEKDSSLECFNNELFFGITAQLSVALSNILANEKVEAQLVEINNYKLQLQDEKSYLRAELANNYNNGELIGSGNKMTGVFEMINIVACTNSTVLLMGETGTGKELIARAIHNNSARKDSLMIKVNCAAIPANLIESELFGHEKGSFTGASERRIGKFELANNGTLFLDEIGEMTIDLQVKLLRVLQEKEIERIGGKGSIKVNVRIIAATNRDLLKDTESGKFRSDLYYRLIVFPINLPPLRERKEDLPELVHFFISKFAKKTGKKVEGISSKAFEDLTAYSWPGNVRELEHLMERSVLLANGTIIREIQLLARSKGVPPRNEKDYIKTINEMERDHILNVLKKCNGKVFGPHGAAHKLGVPVSTLNSKIAKLGIIKEKIISLNQVS